jgi:outer membrane protein TolC
LPPSWSLGDAIEATLARQPGVEITHQQVLERQGDQQSASGQFDWTVGSFFSKEITRIPTGADAPFPTVDQSDASVYSVGVAKQFRNGISVSPRATVVDARDNLSSPVFISQSKLALKITVPLLRGLGAKNTGAQEIAARIAADAQENLARYQVEQLVFQTTSAYWNCLAARANVEIIRDTVKRAEKIVGTVEILAKGGELDSATRDQARALLSTKRGQLEDAELTYYSSRQSLALAIGLGPKQLASTPTVADEFPRVIDGAAVRSAVDDKYVSEALARRGDYLAANLGANAQEALLAQARNNLKPRLDLEVTPGYSGYDNQPGRFRPGYALSNNLTGGNILASVTLEWPTANHVARGALASQHGRTEEAKLNATQAANGIAAGVLVALETLRRTIAEYALSSEAADTYRRAVAQTSDKLTAGEASLTDLIDMEDRFASARQVQIDNIRKYAITLAQLRLLTGTLGSTADHRAVFEVRTFTDLPFPP